MRMVYLKGVVLKLISEGHGQIHVLTEKVKHIPYQRQKIPEMRVNQKKQRAMTPLKRALTELRHARRIRFDHEQRKYVLVDRPTYHPPESIEKLLERHRKTIPNISKDVLIL